MKEEEVRNISDGFRILRYLIKSKASITISSALPITREPVVKTVKSSVKL